MDGFLGGLLTSRHSPRLAYDPAQQAGMLALALEPRFMFDAAGAATAEVVQDQAAGQEGGGEPGAELPVAGQDAAANGSAGEDAAFAQALAEHELPVSGGTEVVVVDRSLASADALIAALPPGTEVIELTPDERGFDQLAERLAGRADIDAIHILSHATPGELRLAGDQITAGNLDRYVEALQAIGQTLAADGDLLIYGCDLASTADGQALVRAIAEHSGADVAASTDTTGSALVDGDWDLEYRVGEVEAEPADVLPASLLAEFAEAFAPPIGVDLNVLPGGSVSFDWNNGHVSLSNITLPGHGVLEQEIYSSWQQVGSSPYDGVFDTGYYGVVGQLRYTNDDDGATTDSFTIANFVYTVTIGTPNEAPTIDGTSAGQSVDDTATVSPFSSVTLADADGDNLTVTVALDASAKGGFTAASLLASGFTDGGGGSYTLASTTAASAQAALRALVFDPANDRALPGGTETTTFTITANDGTVSANNSATTVVSTSINDAPTLAGGPYAFTATDEDTTSAGTVVSTILAGLAHADVDSGAAAGIAITAATGNGSWQYSTDGSSWTDFGTVANGAALLLSSATQVRYVPDGMDGETPSITFRAWDQTAGSASANGSPSTGDASASGGTSAFSSGTADASLTVTAVDDPPTLTTSRSGTVDYTENDSDFFVDPAITISDPDGGSLDGAQVAITNYVSGEDSLSLAGDHGAITASFDAGTGILSLSGAASPAAYQAALRDVKYENSSDNPDTTQRNFSISLGENSLYSPDTGHFYEFVTASAITWTAAESAAEALSLFGLEGYLATVTSALENAFIQTKLVSQGWMGASDAAVEGVWRWATGPEAGTLLNDGYTNWSSGEPNNAGNEDYAHFLLNGKWNDYAVNNGSIQGYVVEYGGLPGDPSVQVQQTVTVDIVPENDAPTVANPIADQGASEDGAFSFQFASNAFADADAGDSLTYGATLASGDPLPAWLTFTAATRTYSGTPANGDVGAITVRVTATDGSSASVSDDFALTVANTNDAPTLANPIADQSAAEDAPFSFQVPANSFADIDAGDNLTYGATLASGDPLPSWLTFTAATRTFSGTPANADVGAITVRVSATDGSSASVTDDFALTVANANDAPTLANPIADQGANEDGAFNFQVPANSFADVDAGDGLTYGATLSGGGDLPGWLSFDPATRTFSGTPENGDVGALTVRVTATDGSGASASDDFSVVVANTNDAPTATGAIADRDVAIGTAFSLALPADLFADVDAGDNLTWSALGADGSPLPGWLRFDAARHSFSGSPSPGQEGISQIVVSATDPSGASASLSFRVQVLPELGGNPEFRVDDASPTPPDSGLDFGDGGADPDGPGNDNSADQADRYITLDGGTPGPTGSFAAGTTPFGGDFGSPFGGFAGGGLGGSLGGGLLGGDLWAQLDQLQGLWNLGDGFGPGGDDLLQRLGESDGAPDALPVDEPAPPDDAGSASDPALRFAVIAGAGAAPPEFSAQLQAAARRFEAEGRALTEALAAAA